MGGNLLTEFFLISALLFTQIAVMCVYSVIARKTDFCFVFRKSVGFFACSADMSFTKVAILADIHLPERTDTVKEPVYAWALAEAQRRGAQLLVGAGDMTSLGTVGAARRVIKGMRDTGLPYLNAPGNAEWRTRAQTTEVLAMLDGNCQLDNVVTLDNAHLELSEETKTFIRQLSETGQKNLLVVAHCPIFSMSPDDQVFLDDFVVSGVIGCFISGHKHRDTEDEHYPVIRGLDPDKAIGNPPALCMMTLTKDGQWQREDIICPLAAPVTWSAAERHSILDWLGFSCMGDAIGGLKAATEYHVPSVEIRFDRTLFTEGLDELVELVGNWREAGGRYLSVHAPSIGSDGRNDFTGVDDVVLASEAAVCLGCQAVTMHVPSKHAVSRVIGNYKERLLTAYSEGLAPLAAADITIGIENMHLTREERIDANRGYGYTPDECRYWIQLLRQRMGYENIGFHLDIGHARNNARFASRYNLSEWYVEMGQELTGCHLHQVGLLSDGRMGNHMPLDTLFGQFISLSSFLMAWRCGQLRKVPLYLEIRTEPGLRSLLALRQALA